MHATHTEGLLGAPILWARSRKTAWHVDEGSSRDDLDLIKSLRGTNRPAGEGTQRRPASGKVPEKEHRVSGRGREQVRTPARPVRGFREPLGTGPGPRPLTGGAWLSDQPAWPGQQPRCSHRVTEGRGRLAPCRVPGAQ